MKTQGTWAPWRWGFLAILALGTFSILSPSAWADQPTKADAPRVPLTTGAVNDNSKAPQDQIQQAPGRLDPAELQKIAEMRRAERMQAKLRETQLRLAEIEAHLTEALKHLQTEEPASKDADSKKVNWQTDYNAARKEAVDKEKAMFVYFRTNSSHSCPRFEEHVLQDQGILHLLNQGFVLLKIEDAENAVLTQAMRVDSYPTTILAAPDGRILDTINGVVTAATLHGRLRAALDHVSPADDNKQRLKQVERHLKELVREVETLQKEVQRDLNTNGTRSVPATQEKPQASR